MANASINDVAQHLKEEVLSALEKSEVSIEEGHVKTYRALKFVLSHSIIITSLGSQPQPETTAGFGAFYDFAIILIVKHTNQDESLQQAEHDLNEIEHHLNEHLAYARNNLWRKLTFPRPSVHPSAPAEIPNSRYAEMYVRTHLR